MPIENKNHELIHAPNVAEFQPNFQSFLYANIKVIIDHDGGDNDRHGNLPGGRQWHSGVQW